MEQMVKEIEKKKSDDVIFEVKNLKKHFPVYGGFFKKQVAAVKALDDVSLYIKKGETLGVVGESFSLYVVKPL